MIAKRLIGVSITIAGLSCAPGYHEVAPTSYRHTATPNFLWSDLSEGGTACGDSLPGIVGMGWRDATIAFQADSAGPAKIQLFCGDGSLLGTLLDTTIEKGWQVVKWYGRDRADSLLLDGHFKYRVQLTDTVLEGELTLTPPETPLAELQQDYPNPFSAGTSVQFYLHDSAAVVLKLYNVKGETVRTLSDSTVCAPGYHRLLWDGKTDSGVAVPNGIYFYRLAAGNTSLTRKMTLLR